MKRIVKKEIINAFIILISGIISALGLHIFVYPYNFAPSGIDGISTMLQYLTDFKVNAGVFNFAINFPLLIAAWFILKKRYVIYTFIYMLISSVGLMVLDAIDFYQYIADNGELIAAVFAGVAQGVTAFMLKIGGSAGGVDVMSSMINKKAPHVRVEKIILILSVLTIFLSYFVFWDMQSMLLSIIEVFVCERVSEIVLRNGRNAVKFEIITDKPNEIADEIIYNLNHGATLVNGTGMFYKQGKSVLFVVVNHNQIAEFLNIISSYPGTFAYYLDVMGVHGNFDRIKGENTELDKLLDRKNKQENVED